MNREYHSIVLAAGRGTRMCSEKPKVIHELIDMPMINLVLKELNAAGISNNTLVVGYEQKQVMEVVNKKFDNIKYVEQEKQLGTGDAVKQAKTILNNIEGITIITCGDTPLVTAKIFKNLLEFHEKNNNDLTILSAEVGDSSNYGRIVREDNVLEAIIEEADADQEIKKIKEINTGIYCVDNKLLFNYIDKLKNDNKQEEYYLTDIVHLFKKDKKRIDAFKIYDEESIMGVNDLIALSKATKVYQRRINYNHMQKGIKIIDPDNTYIGGDVQIQKGTVIFPNNCITGRTTIGNNNILKAGNVIEDSFIGDDNQIGPMSYLRNNNHIHDKTRIGCFVEMKNVNFNNNSKSAHLTYLGDSDIGSNVNIGCGVITANYDGINKHKTIIDDNAFIGSNVNVVAPCHIGEKTFIAAGTTVAKEIGNNKFVIGRVRAEIKENKNK